MNICEDKIKVFLERLFPLQESEQQILCPRCGHNELYTGNYFLWLSLLVSHPRASDSQNQPLRQ